MFCCCFLLNSYFFPFLGLPCKTLYAPHHGTINCTGFYVGDQCSYGCSQGFELQGFSQKSCLVNSRWSAGEPKCVGMYIPM